MRRKLIVITSFFIAVMEAVAQHRAEPTTKKYQSPDRAIVAVIKSTKAPEATEESSCEFRSASGKILARKSYASADGEHGYGVIKAAWTPDSQFFVYSLASSGGHQAWHSPVKF